MIDAETYAENIGVNLDTAIYRLGIQSEIGELDGILELSEKDSFAGLHIQHKPVYRIYVLYKHHKTKKSKGNKTFNGRLNSRLAKTKWRSFVKLRKVDFSLAELKNIQNETLNIVRDIGIPVDSSIDVTKNSVELAVINVTELNDALSYAGLSLPNSVHVIEVSQLSGTESLYGGLSTSDCTLGFSVKNNSGIRGITTAQHCDNIQFVEGGPELIYKNGERRGSLDVQWHTSYDPEQIYENIIKTCDFFGVTCGWRVINKTVSSNTQAIGEHVCKYGAVTGYGCGFITSKTHVSNGVVGSNATFVRVSNNGSKITADGDSGGPWFVDNAAYGIHHGGVPQYSIYMPINYISSLGLTVLTN